MKTSFQISHAVACLSLALISTQASHANTIGGATYTPNWVLPTQKRIFTASDGKVRAQLTVKRNIFDEGNAKTSGKLTIFRNGILAGSDSYVSQKGKADIVNISGPMLAAIGDQDEPAVEVHKQCYQELYDYEYAYDDQTKHYEKRKPSIDLGDISSQRTVINGNSFSTVGNTRAALHWQQKIYAFGGSDLRLVIKKGKRVLYSNAVEPPEIAGSDGKKDQTPECFGPFVTTQIDPSGKIMTDLRVTRIVGHARLGCEMIYYYDRAAHKMRVSTHEWGLNSPRLADLNGDNKIEYVTEDWGLSQPDMGGPIQIWRWGKGAKLVNVTKQFPYEIKRHMNACLKQWKIDHTRANVLGYVGDLCLLNRKTTAIKELHRLNSDTETNDKITAQLKAANYL
ncbi:MAG: hypothetical protein HYX67_14830 [Candidatus Melainabacteria bacterium]|nr:hypothetical protein [Candidatus Melainabacteria bacterium]